MWFHARLTVAKTRQPGYSTPGSYTIIRMGALCVFDCRPSTRRAMLAGLRVQRRVDAPASQLFMPRFRLSKITRR